MCVDNIKIRINLWHMQVIKVISQIYRIDLENIRKDQQICVMIHMIRYYFNPLEFRWNTTLVQSHFCDNKSR